MPTRDCFPNGDDVDDYGDEDGLTCKLCGEGYLMWDVNHHDVTGKWRLVSMDYPPAKIHVCPRPRAQDDFGPLEDK